MILLKSLVSKSIRKLRSSTCKHTKSKSQGKEKEKKEQRSRVVQQPSAKSTIVASFRKQCPVIVQRGFFVHTPEYLCNRWAHIPPHSLNALCVKLWLLLVPLLVHVANIPMQPRRKHQPHTSSEAGERITSSHGGRWHRRNGAQIASKGLLQLIVDCISRGNKKPSALQQTSFWSAGCMAGTPSRI